MSISSALYSSFYGLRNTESRISVVSQNVTNADKAGYTRKELTSDYTTTNAGTVPINSTVETVNYNDYMLETLVGDTALASKNSLISQYLSDYVSELGSTDGGNSISAYFDDFATALDRLSVTPEDTSLKNQVVAAADRVADELNRLSNSAQTNRLNADKEIERTISEVNNILTSLDTLNDKITQTNTLGNSTSNLIDERNLKIEELSKLINIDYFVTGNNELQIYSGGRPLLDSRARELEYTANTALNKTTLYPAGFNPIDLDGTDITTSLTGGELGALVSVRDGLMVEEQEKLDEFANVMANQLNTILNQGAALPPRIEMVGDTLPVAPGDVMGATGNVRIATIDANGVVQNTQDFDLSTYANVGAMIADINATFGGDVTASITPNGQLSLVSNNTGEGLALNQLTSNFPSGEDFSTFFGMNNLFNGEGADNIQVSQYLLDNGHYLATSRLSDAGGLTAGDVGVNIGDSTLATELQNGLNTQYSYGAAGNFATQTETLNNYIDKVISDAAYRANNAKTDANVTEAIMTQTKTTLENISGVNIDEEMAQLIDLEAKYEAAATMLKTLQEMYDTLVGAVR